MNQNDAVEQAIEYFRSPQWHDVLHTVQLRDMNHMHVYVDTWLDPAENLRPLIDGFFANLGWQTYRPIEIMADKPGKAALYGIHLEDKLNFEIYCRFTPGTALAPMVPRYSERGGNLRAWSVADIRRFQDQFRWREANADVHAELDRFFQRGAHWQKALDYVVDSDVMHVHCNVETSVHPDIIREHALNDLARRGFTIKHSIHSIFNANGYDSGKIIFIGLNPARTYDIAYYYNRDVLIGVNTQETHMIGGAGTGNEFYIVRVSVLEAELAKHDLLKLGPDQIDCVLKAVVGFQKRSAYSWRFVPTGQAY
jgi:hypothetical protein